MNVTSGRNQPISKMLRPPVLMRSIRESQQSVRRNFRKFSTKRKKAFRRPSERFKSLSADDTEFVLTLTINEQIQHNGDNESVFYKDDEDRFQKRYTLKLKTFSDYIISIEVKPALQIAYLKLGGWKYEEPKATSTDPAEPETFYRFNWSTNGIDITQRKYRTIVPCVIKFRGYKELSFKLSVKFYDNEEDTHYSGIPFSSLCLDGVLASNKDSRSHLFHEIYD